MCWMVKDVVQKMRIMKLVDMSVKNQLSIIYSKILFGILIYVIVSVTKNEKLMNIEMLAHA